MKFRKRPIVVEAMQWRGGDTRDLSDFCDGRNWSRADAVGSESWPSGILDKEQLVIYNSAEETWLPVPVGWWIVRGIQGELFPVKPDIFVQTYEPVDNAG